MGGLNPQTPLLVRQCIQLQYFNDFPDNELTKFRVFIDPGFLLPPVKFP